MAYLRLIRYKNLLIIALFQILLRYWLILPILERHSIAPALSHLQFALVVLATLMLAAAGNVINDYFDIRIDTINRPDKVIIGRAIERRSALMLHVILTLTGVFVGLYIAFAFRKESYALLFIGVPFLLWYYSTYFKRQMLSGNIIVALLTALVAYLVVSVEFAALEMQTGRQIIETEACSRAWFYTTGFAAFAFISTLLREIIKDMEDTRGDREAGCRTMPIEIGATNCKIIVVLLTAFMLIVLWTSFGMFSWLQRVPYAAPYFALMLTMPSIYVAYATFKAQDARQFHHASRVCKLMMLFGILFILLLGSSI